MITPKKNLPMRFTAYTQCFRAEAGAAEERHKRNDKKSSIL